MKLRAALAVLGLFLLSVVVASTSAPAQATTGVFHCGKWRSTYASARVRTCVKFTDVTEHFNKFYSDGAYNGAPNQAIPFSCQTSKATTFTWGVTATVKMEAGVIFAHAETDISGSIQHSSTTTFSSSSTIKIPAHSWGHCYRGMLTWSAKGVVRQQACGDIRCTTDDKAFSFHAPTTAVWKMGLGRPA